MAGKMPGVSFQKSLAFPVLNHAKVDRYLDYLHTTIGPTRSNPYVAAVLKLDQYLDDHGPSKMS